MGLRDTGQSCSEPWFGIHNMNGVAIALRCPGIGKRWMETAQMMLFRLEFPAPISAGHSLWCETVGYEPVFNLIWMEFLCIKGHVAGGDFQVN